MSVIEKLLGIDSNNLPGEKAHEEMTIGTNRFINSQYRQALAAAPKSAVVFAISVAEREANGILMVRSYQSKHHAGQIAIPGGKVEEGDKNLMHTAFREFHEEIGDAIDESKIIKDTALTPLYIPVSNFSVYPFLVMTEQQFLPDPNHEVEEVLHLDLNAFSKVDIVQDNVKLHQGQTLKNVAQFRVEDRIIWGATGLILNEIRHILKK